MFLVSESNSKRLRMYGQICTPHNCFSIRARSVLAKTSPMREISSVYEIFFVLNINRSKYPEFRPQGTNLGVGYDMIEHGNWDMWPDFDDDSPWLSHWQPPHPGPTGLQQTMHRLHGYIWAAKNVVEQLNYLPRICLCTSMNHCVEKYILNFEHPPVFQN